MIDTLHINIIEGLLVAVLGMIVVFVVLIFLMGVIKVQSAVVSAIENKNNQESAPETDSAPVPASALSPAPAAPAKGSCGNVMLHDVPDATAAMIMAIVADELNTPLNELRFISIQEVKSNEI